MTSTQSTRSQNIRYYDITAAEHKVIDQAVAEFLAKGSVKKSVFERLKSVIWGRHPDRDLWNSRWAGFKSIEGIGPGVYLDDVINVSFADLGDPNDPASEDDDLTDDDRLDHMHGYLNHQLEGSGTHYILNELRTTTGECAWIYAQNEEDGSIHIDGLTESPAAMEVKMRAEGYVFPLGETPSGVVDTITDAYLLERFYALSGNGKVGTVR